MIRSASRYLSGATDRKQVGASLYQMLHGLMEHDVLSYRLQLYLNHLVYIEMRRLWNLVTSITLVEN